MPDINYRLYCFRKAIVFTNITGYFHDLRRMGYRKENPKPVPGSSDVE